MSGYHKTSISLDPDIARRAQERARALGFKQSFSAYIAKLIEDDLHERPALQETPLQETAAPLPPPPGPPGKVTTYRAKRSRKANRKVA